MNLVQSNVSLVTVGFRANVLFYFTCPLYIVQCWFYVVVK